MNNKISIITVSVMISIVIFGIFITFSKENVSIDYISVFQQINQTDISYIDTHVESIDGKHYATINKTEIVDENTVKIIFRDDNFGYGGGGTYSYKIPSFEFTKIVKKGDIFIATCIERDVPKQNIVDILQLADIANEDLSFHHYNGVIPKTIECKYPDIIKDSFDFDWKFTEVQGSDIKSIPWP